MGHCNYFADCTEANSCLQFPHLLLQHKLRLHDPIKSPSVFVGLEAEVVAVVLAPYRVRSGVYSFTLSNSVRKIGLERMQIALLR